MVIPLHIIMIGVALCLTYSSPGKDVNELRKERRK